MYTYDELNYTSTSCNRSIITTCLLWQGNPLALHNAFNSSRVLCFCDGGWAIALFIKAVFLSCFGSNLWVFKKLRRVTSFTDFSLNAMNLALIFPEPLKSKWHEISNEKLTIIKMLFLIAKSARSEIWN